MKADFASRGFGNRALTATSHYRDRQLIFAQGDDADAIFLVRRGHVKLTIAAEGKKKAAIAILGAGDCFGEGCLVEDSFRTSTAVSVQRSTVDHVSRAAMVRRLGKEPALATLFISHLLSRIGTAEGDLVDQLVNPSEQRLARLLLKLSAYGERNGRGPAVVNVDQGTLAQMVGTTRSRVSHFMNDFRKRGFIDYNGSIHVHKALLSFLLLKRAPRLKEKALYVVAS